MKEFIKNGSFSIIFNLLAALIGFAISQIYSNRNRILIWIKLLRVKEVRFSISYLFKIKIDNKYLLIKGNRINQHQPIGGVYKYYESFSEKINEWKIVDDDNIPLDKNNSKDLRVRVPKKYVLKFLNWFESYKNREYCIFREFYEEVLKETPEKASLFCNNFQAEFIRRDNSGLQFSEHFQCNEILIADIFDLKLSPEQETALKELAGQNGKFRLCTYDEIIKKHFLENRVSNSIGKHTIKTL